MPSRRDQVRARAKGLCEYCGYPDAISPGPFAVEHIIPRTAAGSNSLENLAWACDGCNGYKAAATHGSDPSTGECPPLFNPRTQKWADHFEWNIDRLEMLGISPTGRATVDRLRLNRHGLVRVRRVQKKMPLDRLV